MLSQAPIFCAPSGKPGRLDCLYIAILIASRDHRSYREMRRFARKMCQSPFREIAPNPAEITMSEVTAKSRIDRPEGPIGLHNREMIVRDLRFLVLYVFFPNLI